ncbi:hypothetical protein [Rhodopseudomonas palustris]|uniref:hypothetical protein n=1 Tax=Rhodopseudomonas palustris TaxID=1076 RepID=UPI000CEB9654|nr:hypothetical protein [Rhodopseudomonas palustris]PPQ42182.1 hypothetical protein CKO39_18505 [Rhodopseudomonas palustris]
MSLKVGDAARIPHSTFTGTIAEQRFDPKEGTREVLFVWTDADGVEQHRWFAEDQLEVITTGA